MRVASFDVGFLNMAVCIAATNGARFTIETWERWQIGGPDTPSAVLVELLLRRLHEERGLFVDVDVVVVERQLVTKLSVLAHTLQAYFVTRQLVDDSGPGVLLQHGTRKNQCGGWLARMGRTPADTGKAAYAVYKRRAVEDARQALGLQDEQGWVDVFARDAKPDDLADALLHALWYLFCRPRARS